MRLLGRRSGLLFAGGGFTSPASLPNLKLWLAADRITGLADADPVPTWSDLSGGGNNASQGTAGSRPTYRTNVVNGKPVVRFDGTDDFLQASVSGTGAFTQFVVAKMAAGAVRRTLLATYSGATPRTGFQRNSNDFTRVFDTTGAGGGSPVTGPQWGSTLFHVAAFVLAPAATSEAFLDGTSSLTYTASAAGAYSRDTLYLGATGGTSEWLANDLAEVIIYDRALSAAERLLIERHLGTKYGVTVL